ncbi:uncharacterized protein LOC144008046 isoform X2 [Festucalex cinctus]
MNCEANISLASQGHDKHLRLVEAPAFVRGTKRKWTNVVSTRVFFFGGGGQEKASRLVQPSPLSSPGCSNVFFSLLLGCLRLWEGPSHPTAAVAQKGPRLCACVEQPHETHQVEKMSDKLVKLFGG